MARVETPPYPGAVPTGMAMLGAVVPPGAKCTCGKPAKHRWSNSWRRSDACGSEECTKRERHWVGGGLETEGLDHLPNELYFVCPCGGQACVTKSLSGLGPPAAMHAKPACADFIEKEVVEYLEWINEKCREKNS